MQNKTFQFMTKSRTRKQEIVHLIYFIRKSINSGQAENDMHSGRRNSDISTKKNHLSSVSSSFDIDSMREENEIQ